MGLSFSFPDKYVVIESVTQDSEYWKQELLDSIFKILDKKFTGGKYEGNILHKLQNYLTEIFSKAHAKGFIDSKPGFYSTQNYNTLPIETFIVSINVPNIPSHIVVKASVHKREPIQYITPIKPGESYINESNDGI